MALQRGFNHLHPMDLNVLFLLNWRIGADDAACGLPSHPHLDLDHTADVQIHAWGASLKDTFEQSAIAMLGYMTDLEKVNIDDVVEPIQGTVQGHDLESLLYNFLEEILFIFNTEFVIFKTVKIDKFDEDTFTIEFTGTGEKWDLSKHEQGTEVKAITYSAMKILAPGEHSDKHQIYVIVDI